MLAEVHLAFMVKLVYMVNLVYMVHEGTCGTRIYTRPVVYMVYNITSDAYGIHEYVLCTWYKIIHL